MAGSFQSVILPVKMSSMVWAFRIRFLICCPLFPCRLYMKARAPATSGRYW